MHDMKTERLATLSFIISLWLLGHVAFAGQGCCSTHGGVAGCVGARLQCGDGTLSPTCSCQDAEISSMSQTQDRLALMQAGSPEVKPYATPITSPIPTKTIDTIPSQESNKPYTTPATQPSSPPSQPDVVPLQKPPESYYQQGTEQESTPKSAPEETDKPSTAGNMQKQVERGQAPKSIDRVDRARSPYEKDQVHFQDGNALNKDGSWKHGGRSLTNSEKKWLVKNGWTLPK
jgi:hypothetical protein